MALKACALTSAFSAALRPGAARLRCRPSAIRRSSSSSSSADIPWHAAADEAAAAMRDAESILFVTGAGISADSGMPTYRGVSGLYEKADTPEGLAIEECLSGGMLAANPDLTWKYLLQIERACRESKPNRVHHIIAGLGKKKRVTVLTQNVDGLHLEAGSGDVIEIHGNVHRLECTSCGAKTTAENYVEIEKAPVPPVCSSCGGMIRPQVVLFDEALPADEIQRLDAAVNLRRMSGADGDGGPANGRFDVSVLVGTTAGFRYIVEAAWSARTKIEINPGETPVSNLVTIRVQAGAAESLGYMFPEEGL